MPPIYEYVCTKCEKEEDRLVSFSNADQQQCTCEDDAPMERKDMIHKTSFTLKGRGWFKKGGY